MTAADRVAGLLAAPDPTATDRLIADLKATGAEAATSTPVSPPTREGSKAMPNDIEVHHEEMAVYGTGIAHLILPGRPAYVGRLPTSRGQWTRILDGSLVLSIDPETVPRWRRVFELAEADLARTGPEPTASEREDAYAAMSTEDLHAFAVRVMREYPHAFDVGAAAVRRHRERMGVGRSEVPDAS